MHNKKLCSLVSRTHLTNLHSLDYTLHSTHNCLIHFSFNLGQGLVMLHFYTTENATHVTGKNYIVH